MGGTLEDLVNEIENEELEKNASVDETDALAEEVMKRAMEKVAKQKTKPKAEKQPDEMLEEAEDEDVEEIEEELEKEADKDDGDEESEEEEKIEEEVEEELRGLSQKQKEKVASVSQNFTSDAKQELFEKLASFQLLSNPRVIRDNNFQKYETLDGLPKEIQMLFDDQGEEVNNI
jgi:chemotaxis protein histidine kinase CheA